MASNGFCIDLEGNTYGLEESDIGTFVWASYGVCAWCHHQVSMDMLIRIKEDAICTDCLSVLAQKYGTIQ